MDDDFTDLQSNRKAPERFPHYGYRAQRTNSFMVLSLCFGIISITCCSVIFLSMIMCGLSILFAILSMGNDKRLSPLCKAGIGASVFGLVCSICVTAFACYMIFNDSTYRQQMNEACQQIYGVSFDDMMKDLERK